MNVLELGVNIFQSMVVLVMFAVSIFYAVKNVSYLLFQYISGIYISWFMGNLFWTSYFYICGDFPYYFSPSEICYMASFLFIIGISNYLFNTRKKPLSLKENFISLIFPLFVFISNAFCYYKVGGFFWISYYAIPLIVIAFLASRNIFVLKTTRNLYGLNLSLMLLVAVLNIMYVVSSCGFNHVYILLDFSLIIIFPFLFVFVKKESGL